jgi:hypothetical protein
MGYPEPFFSKPKTGQSLNQNPWHGGCFILEIFKELPNIGLFINLCSNNCVSHLSMRKMGQSFLEECNLLLCLYSVRETVTTVITIYFCAKCWLLDYSEPQKAWRPFCAND